MRATYAVVWREGDEPPASGRLELRSRSIAFIGAGEGRAVERDVPFASLRTVRVGRAPVDRLDGRCSLVLELRSGPPIRLAGVAQPGIVSELAERLAGLDPAAIRAARRFVVTLPLEKGAADKARELIEAGPPFDPEETGLVRHRVFLLEREAIFLFEAADDDERLAEMLGRPEIWAAAGAWRDLASGPPRIAEEVYDWERPLPVSPNGNGKPD